MSTGGEDTTQGGAQTRPLLRSESRGIRWDLGSCQCGGGQDHGRLCGRDRSETPNIPTNSADTSAISNSRRQHVEALKTRLQTAEALLAKEDLSDSPGVPLALKAIHGLKGPIAAPHPEDLAFADIEASFRALSIHGKAGFYGNSSSARLLKSAVDMRSDKLLPEAHPPCRAVPDTIQSWKGHVPPPMTIYSFPETDLLVSLVSKYFDNVNNLFPLLHRQAFEQDVRQHFHKTHSGFAKVVLLVCALGALYSTDPRVYGPKMTAEPRGCKWFNQVNPSGHLVQIYASVYDIQVYCLSVEFLDATANPRVCWNAVGFGMRAAQDLGLHRSKGTGAPTFTQELERRASWLLLLFDTQIGTALGRGSTLQSLELDLSMPMLCDDEFWGTLDTLPHMRFRQPAAKPSTVAFFNCMINLNRILALSCEILYSPDVKTVEMGLADDGWQARVVEELDSALNAWFVTIPAHLRWDPDSLIPDDTFFDQSGALYCAYYHTRIVIHRPFTRRTQRPTHLSSLAICKTAARACTLVAEIQHRRRPNNPLWFSKTALFTSGIVLLMNIWSGSGNVMARSKDLQNVRRIITILTSQQRQWPSVGPLLETLQQLMFMNDPSAPHASHEDAPIQPCPLSVSDYPRPAGSIAPVFDPQLETAPPDDYLEGFLSDRRDSVRQRGPSSFTPRADTAGWSIDPASLYSAAPPGFGLPAWQTFGRIVSSGIEGQPSE